MSAGASSPRLVPVGDVARLLPAGESRLEIVPGAGHLFEEPAALEPVARLAGDWFVAHLTGRRSQQAPHG